MTQKQTDNFLCLSTATTGVKRETEQKPKPPKKSDSTVSCFAIFLPLRFSLSTSVVEEIPSVKLRELFPFLSWDDIEGRAKQSVKNQLEPQLLNSYQGHQKSITGLIYHEANQVLISSSRDKSVRLWNLSGQVVIVISRLTLQLSSFSSPFAVHRHDR